MGPGLVGRSAELAAIDAAVERLDAGEGTHLHVAGDAGLGKSALLDAVDVAARRRRIDALRGAAEDTDRHRHLALATRLFGPTWHAGDDAVGAAIAAVETLARSRPLAVLADDLHWADEISLDALRAVGRRATALGVLLVTTGRRHPMPGGLRALEAAARRDGMLLTLQPLDSAAQNRLVQAQLDARIGPRLTSLLAGAGGNPFLVGELLRALRAGGDLDATDGHIELREGASVPDQLASSILEHMLLMVPESEALLTAGAALPAGFTPAELAALSGQPLGDVVASVGALVACGVLVDRSAGLAFRHELLGDAVRGAIAPAVLTAMASRAADLLPEMGATPDRVAACLVSAVDPATGPAAIERLISQARATANDNPLAGAELLAHALRGVGVADNRNRQLTLELGWLLIAAGRAADVPALVAERFPDSTADSALDLDRLVGHALTLSGKLREVQARFAARTVETITADGDAADGEFVDAVAELAQLRVALGETRVADALLHWVAASPTPASVTRCVAVETTRSYLHGIAGEFAESVACAERARQAVGASGEPTVPAISATLSGALSLDLGGDAAGAQRLLRSPQPGPFVRWAPPLLQFVTALTLYRQGEWDDALAEAAAGLGAADEVDLGIGVFWPYALQTLIHRARGDAAVADDWLGRAQTTAGQHSLGVEWLMLATAVTQFDRGDISSAATTLELLVSGVLTAGAPALLLASGPLATLIFLASGRRPLAERLVAEIATMRTRSRSPVVAGVGDWTSGLIAEEPDAIATAVSVLAANGRRPEAALAAHDTAVTALRRRQPSMARAFAERAFAGFDELGADRWHRRLRAELRDYGLSMRPRRAPRRARFGWNALTPSERAVVDLLAEGLTNTEIAARLFISRRTVESHLARVYTKLDCATRSQLIATAARA